MQPNIIKSTMNSGLIMGILFSLNFLLSISKNTFAALITYLIMSFILVGIYKMTVIFRDKENGGSISYGKSFSFIVYTFFFAALISSTVKYVYFEYINPNSFEALMQESIKMLGSMNFTLDKENTEEITSLRISTFTIQYLWMNVFIGGIIGLILSAFIKKNLPKPTEQTDL